MSRRVALVVWLTLLWVGLWRDASVANLTSGLVVAVATSSVFASRGGRDRGPDGGSDVQHRFKPWGAAAFLVYFGGKLVEANLALARAVLSRRDRTRTGIIAVELGDASDLLVTIVANAVTLTPGTMTLQTARHPRTLYVHVLHLHDPERVRRDIHRLEHLARWALGYEDVPGARRGEA